MATLEQRVYDGAKAREVLENEAFAQAFADIRQEITKAWMDSPARDVEGREKLHTMLKLADKLQSTLEAAMTDGKMAKLQIEHQAAQDARDRARGVNVNGWQS
jgi:hypothetical protein